MQKPETINKGDKVILNTYLFDKLVCFKDGKYYPASCTSNIAGIALANTEYDKATNSHKVLVRMY